MNCVYLNGHIVIRYKLSIIIYSDLKIKKCFAVFADIWTESYIQFGFIVSVSLHLKLTV